MRWPTPKLKLTWVTEIQFILERETCKDLLDSMLKIPEVHQFLTKGPLLWIINVLHICEAKHNRRGSLCIPLTEALQPQFCCHHPQPVWRKLADSFFFLQYFNQYIWRPSKYGLLSSVWCNRWPAYRARTSLPLCPASRCTSRWNWEGKKWSLVATQEFGNS